MTTTQISYLNSSPAGTNMANGTGTTGSVEVSEEEYNMFYHPHKDIFCYIGLTIGALSVISNIIVIFTILRNRSLKTVANAFRGNLALSDLLFGISIIYAYGWRLASTHANPIITITSYAGISIGVKASLCFLCILAIDMYIALSKPLHYRSIMTKKVVIIGCAVAWSVSAALTFIPFLVVSPKDALGSPLFWFVTDVALNAAIFPICIFAYCYIFRVVLQQRHHPKFRKSKGGIVINFTILILFLVMWIPLVIGKSLANFVEGIYGDQLWIVLEAVMIVAYANAFVNPLVYAIRAKDFRAALTGKQGSRRSIATVRSRTSLSNISSVGSTRSLSSVVLPQQTANYERNRM